MGSRRFGAPPSASSVSTRGRSRIDRHHGEFEPPPARRQTTVSPTRAPSSSRPSGETQLNLPDSRSASSSPTTVRRCSGPPGLTDGHRGAETDRGRAARHATVDHLGGRDSRLVVTQVALDVAQPVAGDRVARRGCAELVALHAELREPLLELRQPGRSHRIRVLRDAPLGQRLVGGGVFFDERAAHDVHCRSSFSPPRSASRTRAVASPDPSRPRRAARAPSRASP